MYLHSSLNYTLITQGLTPNGTLALIIPSSTHGLIPNRTLIIPSLHYTGANTVLAPLYISEVSPIPYRGIMGVFHQVAITITILMAQLLGIHQVKLY